MHDVALTGVVTGVPSVEPGASPAGYLTLDAIGVPPTSIGDEEFRIFSTSPFVYGGVTWNRISVNSNGYLIPGDATAADNNCCDLPDGPDPARPNNLLAPFWTDLDGSGAPGI